MMYLLDTHVLIWSLFDPAKLSASARKLIENSENTILVSSVSFWEIALKYSLNKLSLHGVMPEDFPNLALQTGFKLIPILPEEAASYNRLSVSWHKDPFDRMLIWQAIEQNLVLISKDENISKYKSTGLKVVW